MKVKVLGSSSKGNCYVLEDQGKYLILEAGISYKQVLSVCNFDVNNILGVLVTHEHQDHAKHTKEFLKAGITVFMTKGTADALSLMHHNIKIIKALTSFKLDEYSIMPFDTQHDCKEPTGYLLKHPVAGKILFATDTYFIKYRFRVRHIFVECNYTETLLNASENIYKNRVLKSHMSLETCIEFLKSNDLADLENIILLHLSDSHSDEEYMTNEITKAIGVKPVVAQRGLVVNL